MSQWDDAGDVSEALSNVFTQLRELDRLAVDVTWDEWTETFMQLLERTTYAVAPASHDGVQVLDAMAARGLGFRALFMVGLNEKVFPRFIHEDGFLRDRHRLILSETLGYKIDQKLQGYAEEALLFELLRSAASETLVPVLSTGGYRWSSTRAIDLSGYHRSPCASARYRVGVCLAASMAGSGRTRVVCTAAADS